MKRFVFTLLALFSFSTAPVIKATSSPLEDFGAGLFLGTCPIYGQIWLYQVLRTMKREAIPQKAAVVLPMSLVGTWLWYKASEFLKNNSELGLVSYVIPALPVLITIAVVQAKDAIQNRAPKR